MSTVSEGNQSASNAQSTTIDQGTSTEKHEEGILFLFYT
jgi:hypothetical protein